MKMNYLGQGRDKTAIQIDKNRVLIRIDRNNDLAINNINIHSNVYEITPVQILNTYEYLFYTMPYYELADKRTVNMLKAAYKSAFNVALETLVKRNIPFLTKNFVILNAIKYLYFIDNYSELVELVIHAIVLDYSIDLEFKEGNIGIDDNGNRIYFDVVMLYTPHEEETKMWSNVNISNYEKLLKKINTKY